MSFESWVAWIAGALGFYMAFNIGANDVANAMATSVGAGTLTHRKAVLIAGIAEFIGAVLVGAHVTGTIRKGIVPPAMFAGHGHEFVLGMLAALMGAAVWLHLATHLGQPVSTTHSIVGAIIGFGIVAKGWSAVNWGKVVAIVLSWIISPIGGLFISYLVFSFVRKKILSREDPIEAAKRIGPYLTGLVFVILILAIIYKGLKNLHLDLPLYQALPLALAGGALAGLIMHLALRRASTIGQDFDVTENIFKRLQVLTAAYECFAHGSNDVANAVGPVAAIIGVLTTGDIKAEVEVPIWVLILGAIGIVLGLAIFGHKVMETMGKKITEVTPTRGFAAEFGAATTVLVCSKLGLPVSTTHASVGTIVGVGLARGLWAVNLKVVRQIIAAWVVTLPAAAGLTIIFYKLMLLIL